MPFHQRHTGIVVAAFALVAFVGTTCAAEQTAKTVRLPSGRQVVFLYEGVAQTSDKKTALVAKYATQHAPTAQSALAAEADDVWDLMRVDAEKFRTDTVILMPVFAANNENGKHSFVISKDPRGLWHCATEPKVAGGNPAKWAYYAGIDAIQKGQTKDAIAQLSKSIDLDPKYAQAYTDRGAVYLLLNQPDKAISDFDEALALNPDYPGIYSNRGIALMRLNQFGKAAVDLTKALSLSPNNPASLLNRGICFERLSEHAEAIQDLTAALRLNPNLVEAYSWRATALSNLAAQDKQTMERLAHGPAKNVNQSSSIGNAQKPVSISAKIKPPTQ